jgi:hypothetical protein
MNKKIAVFCFCIGLLSAVINIEVYIQPDKTLVVLDEIEALTACEATFPNESNEIVTIQCAGEKGTCHIKRKQIVKTSYGTFTVYVDGTCSGKSLNE